MLRFVKKAEPIRLSNENLRLAEAAASAFKQVQRERLPLAAIAKRDPRGAIHWFAANMIAIVAVYGVPAGKSGPVLLDESVVGGLQLTEDLNGLRSSKVRPAVFSDLRIAKLEFERYTGWIRTVY